MASSEMAIYLQGRLPSAVICRADRSAIEGVFADTKTFIGSNLEALLASGPPSAHEPVQVNGWLSFDCSQQCGRVSHTGSPAILNRANNLLPLVIR
jgi:hypothetical protein